VVSDARARTKPQLEPRDNLVFGNIIAWPGKAAIVLPADRLGSVSDANLFVSSEAPPAFSLGWPSTASPLRTGLSAWRSASGQDVHSWSEPLAMPESLRAALAARDRHPPWNSLRTLAARRPSTVPQTKLALPAGLDGDAAPGPGR
jgi:hypothetical protein